MKSITKEAVFLVILLSGSQLSDAADQACTCMFVKPPQPSGVSVERASRQLPNPPPLFLNASDRLVIKGMPVATLVCQMADDNGQTVNRIFQISAKPNPQNIPCRAAAVATGDRLPPLPEFEKKRRKLDRRLFSDNLPVGYIWSPREAMIRPDHLALLLNLPDSDTGYILQVRGDTGDTYDAKISRPRDAAGRGPIRIFRYSYPHDAPPLKPGSHYKMSISDPAFRSGPDEANFAVISPQEDDRVKGQIAGIDALEIGDLSKRMLRAAVYAANHLYIDAAAQLRGYPEARTDPDALRMLGDIYRLGESWHAAEAVYGSSVAPVVASKDSPVGHALSYECLGLARESLGQTELARSAYTEAMKLYESFGESASANRVADAIGRLK